jgi:hypothetical protein
MPGGSNEKGPLMPTKVGPATGFDFEVAELLDEALKHVQEWGVPVEDVQDWLRTEGPEGERAAELLPVWLALSTAERCKARGEDSHAYLAYRQAVNRVHVARMRNAAQRRDYRLMLERRPERRRSDARRAPRQAHVSRRSDRTHAPPSEEGPGEPDLEARLARLERRVDALAGLHDAVVADLCWAGVLR